MRRRRPWASGALYKMTIRLDTRYLLPLGALGLVILVVIFVQLCGSDDSPKVDESIVVQDATATAGPSPTPGPSPTQGPVTPTPITPEPTLPPGAPGSPDERDAVRQQDLLAVQAALEQYRADNDEYPDTQGGIQSLCAFPDADP